MRAVLFIAALLFGFQAAWAQPVPPPSGGGARAVATCGTQSLTAGTSYLLFQDLTGTLCAAGGGGGSATPFVPNGNYGTLTATAASSASTAMPAGAVVAFQNMSLIDLSCVLSSGTATATTNKIIVRGGATVFVAVGSNVNAACINQTGVASNAVSMAGGAGLGTNFGGGSSGGGGGAVTLASGAVASGAYSAGSIAAGAFVSGSVLSGAYAAGALVDVTNLSTPVAAAAATATKGLLLGGQFDTTQKTLTNGQQAALSASPRGALYVATGAENLVVVGAGTAGSASGGVLTIQGSASGTAIPVSGASGSIASGAMVDLGSQGDTVCATASGNCSLIALQKFNNVATSGPIPLNVNTVATAQTGVNPSVAQTGTIIAANVDLTSKGGVAFGAMANYGTSPGAVKVDGVNAFVTNTVTTTQTAATAATPIAAAASDNHAVLKNGAGVAMSVHTSNNSATKNYLRLYDAGTGFNGCNSATGVIFAMEIPPSDGGFSVSLGGGTGIAFTAGLSWCITSGFGLTDTTAATASAILANASFR